MSGMHVQQQMPQMTHARVAESPQFQPENPQNGPMTPNRLMSMQQMQSKPLGASSLAITKPDSQQNMFKMQKGRSEYLIANN